MTSSWPPTCGNSAVGASSIAAAATIAPPLTVKSSQPLITSHSPLLSSSSHSPMVRSSKMAMASATSSSGQQILLTGSMPTTILQSPPAPGPTGHHGGHGHHRHHQTAVLPTQVPTVMLGQATATTTGAPQVIPIVQSQGVPQRQILYMTPNTS